MSENIIVDSDKSQYEQIFDVMYLLDLNMGCETESKTLILDYSEMFNFETIRIPPEFLEEYAPENFTTWFYTMPRRMTILDYVTQFGFLHEDLHIVVDHLLRDDCSREELNSVHNWMIDSVECYVILHSLIHDFKGQEEMWNMVSQIYTELWKRDETDIPYVWVPPDMRE